MQSLWDSIPPEMRGAHAANSAALEPAVLNDVRPGDAIMVKGSLGSRMGPIVKALANRYTRADAPESAPA
jgi:UDP-N-acetylmuramoyl-tripeptide--D-alanyl-D-alanine ligase